MYQKNQQDSQEKDFQKQQKKQKKQKKDSQEDFQQSSQNKNQQQLSKREKSIQKQQSQSQEVQEDVKKVQQSSSKIDFQDSSNKQKQIQSIPQGIITQVSKSDPTGHSQVLEALKKERKNLQEKQDDQKQVSLQQGSWFSQQGLIKYFCRCFLPKVDYVEEIMDQVHKKGLDYPEKGFSQRKLLILDLDETLVHSSFQVQKNYDFILEIVVMEQNFTVYINKRPGCNEFLVEMAKYFDIIIYTASLQAYADPVIDEIDPYRVVKGRMFRNSCSIFNNIFVKDLAALGRNLKDVIIIDNSETSFLFQPENAIHIKSYFDDATDIELFYYMPILQLLSKVFDVRNVAKWIDLYEESLDFIEFEDQVGMRQIFSKSQAFIHFEEIFPGRFLNHEEEENSEQQGFTNRQQYTGEDELQIEIGNRKLVSIQQDIEFSSKQTKKKSKKPQITLAEDQLDQIYLGIQNNCSEDFSDKIEPEANSQSELNTLNTPHGQQSSTHRKLINNKAKEYEDTFQSNKRIGKENLPKENVHTSYVNHKYMHQEIEGEQPHYDEYRFQQGQFNINSPVAKENTKIQLFKATSNEKKFTPERKNNEKQNQQQLNSQKLEINYEEEEQIEKLQNPDKQKFQQKNSNESNQFENDNAQTSQQTDVEN